MNYLLDTNQWSHIQRKTPGALARTALRPAGSSLFISVVSQAELLAGVERLADGQRKTDLRGLYEVAMRSSAGVLPIDSRVAERYALVAAQLRRDGTPIGANDMWIGATAIVHDLVLVTNDAHFGYIKGVRVEDWTVA
ncbi:MAG TPA: type II toxin-antitoxin system VapC family toxin [Phycisphaerales bacterium]|nr:type II toxin-antitoxin system VapC family toxin [Phycisphaerales bacterium]